MTNRHNKERPNRGDCKFTEGEFNVHGYMLNSIIQITTHELEGKHTAQEADRMRARLEMEYDNALARVEAAVALGL